ncbi:hypothetical protein [Nocardiopsis alba]|nr:hypothetical protein [Nocardiopsis alba]
MPPPTRSCGAIGNLCALGPDHGQSGAEGMAAVLLAVCRGKG